MMRKFSAVLAAAAFALATLTPAAAHAQYRRDGYYDRGHHGGYYDRHDRRGRYDRRHRDNDDAIVAGVLGLVLGVAIGAAASQPRDQQRYPRYSCTDNYQRCAPPPQAQPYYDQGAYYDDGARSAYEQDYGYAPQAQYAPRQQQCTRRERQWDRYANRYVVVDMPC